MPKFGRYTISTGTDGHLWIYNSYSATSDPFEYASDTTRAIISLSEVSNSTQGWGGGESDWDSPSITQELYPLPPEKAQREVICPRCGFWHKYLNVNSLIACECGKQFFVADSRTRVVGSGNLESESDMNIVEKAEYYGFSSVKEMKRLLNID